MANVRLSEGSELISHPGQCYHKAGYQPEAMSAFVSKCQLLIKGDIAKTMNE